MRARPERHEDRQPVIPRLRPGRPSRYPMEAAGLHPQSARRLDKAARRPHPLQIPPFPPRFLKSLSLSETRGLSKLTRPSGSAHTIVVCYIPVRTSTKHPKQPCCFRPAQSATSSAKPQVRFSRAFPSLPVVAAHPEVATGPCPPSLPCMPAGRHVRAASSNPSPYGFSCLKPSSFPPSLARFHR